MSLRNFGILIFALLFMNTAFPLYAQDVLEDEPAVVEPVDASRKIVKAVEVKGNQSIGISNILSRIKTRVGQEYLQSVISDDLKRLYNTGYFADVSVDRADYEGGFKVIFFVEEKSIVEKISFSRTRYIKPKALKRKIKTKEGEFLDNKTLNDDIRLIEDLFSKKGLTKAKVNVEKEFDSLTNKTKVHFVVREGDRVQIKKINIEGNMSYPDKKILRVIKTRADSWFTSGFLQESTIEEDMERIRSYYEREGYIDARARYDLENINESKLTLIIRIEEGKQYFVDNITVEGNTIFDDHDILDNMDEIKEGKVFSRERLTVDLSNIRTLYFDKGYIFANVRESTSLNSENGKVDVRLDVMEGEQAYINRIKIEGNESTRDIVIRRELRLFPGDKFDGAKLRRSKERLQSLGYFEDISYDVEDTERPNRKDLLVQVKETKTGSFSFGGGFSTVDQFVGFVEIEQKNFDFTNWPRFTGGGQNLTIRAETGSSRNNTRLSFTEPWLFDYPISGGIDAYLTERDREEDIGFAYDEKRVGGALRLGKQFTEYVSGGATYRNERIEVKDFEDGVSADLLAEEGENTVSSLSFTLARDSRDSVFNPTKGLFVRGTVEGAGGILGGDKDFWRANTRTTYDIPVKFPMATPSVLEFQIRTGVVDAYGDSEKVPIFERFFAGGARTIRGYDERKVGPIDPTTEDPTGGEALVIGNIEYTVPIIDFIKVALFFDTGSVWQKIEDFGSGDFKSGAGVGLRVKTPIGPVNLDYGYPLNDEPGEEERSGKFYFSVSRGF